MHASQLRAAFLFKFCDILLLFSFLPVIDPKMQLSFTPPLPIITRPLIGACLVTTSAVNASIQATWKDEAGVAIQTESGVDSVTVSFTFNPYMAINSAFLGDYTCTASINANINGREYQIILTQQVLFTGKLLVHGSVGRTESLRISL